ncbi:TSUP family transporter [Halosegnis longus]|uniref:TSUP family transporter n=1 Tax=Halosegnis longus TaxID=2216012 RepID=UPI00296E60BC
MFATAALGTLLGMVVLEEVPAGPLRVGLGVVTLAFVATAQTVVDVPGVDWMKQRCFVERWWMMGVVGTLSGLVFGGTNVGVQLIAYFKSRDLSHGLFVSVVALVFLGLNGVRVAAAGVLGLYPSRTVVLASVAAAAPAIVGVEIGKRLQTAVADAHRDRFVLLLLTGIGLRLLQVGLS